jgi:hypothetical protein
MDQATILQCRDHYGAFYLAVNPTYSYVRYQQELICPQLEALERGDTDRLMILIEPGHAKSRLCTAGFAPWLLGKRPDREIIIISYGDRPASQFGGIVRDMVGVTQKGATSTFSEIFPWCSLRRDIHARNYFVTTMNGKIHAVGWDGAIASTRADFILIDDPHKNWDEAISETLMERRMMLFNSVVKDRLKPNGKILICTNRWAPRDMIGRILENETYEMVA